MEGDVVHQFQTIKKCLMFTLNFTIDYMCVYECKLCHRTRPEWERDTKLLLLLLLLLLCLCMCSPFLLPSSLLMCVFVFHPSREYFRYYSTHTPLHFPPSLLPYSCGKLMPATDSLYIRNTMLVCEFFFSLSLSLHLCADTWAHNMKSSLRGWERMRD